MKTLFKGLSAVKVRFARPFLPLAFAILLPASSLAAANDEIEFKVITEKRVGRQLAGTVESIISDLHLKTFETERGERRENRLRHFFLLKGGARISINFKDLDYIEVNRFSFGKEGKVKLLSGIEEYGEIQYPETYDPEGDRKILADIEGYTNLAGQRVPWKSQYNLIRGIYRVTPRKPTATPKPSTDVILPNSKNESDSSAYVPGVDESIPLKADIIQLRNGDTISGEVQTKVFEIETSYAKIPFDLSRLNSMSFEGEGQNVDVLNLLNGDKLSGIIYPATITFDLDPSVTEEGEGKKAVLAKDKIKKINFKTRKDKTR